MFERSLPAVSRYGRHHIAVQSYKASTLKVLDKEDRKYV